MDLHLFEAARSLASLHVCCVCQVLCPDNVCCPANLWLDNVPALLDHAPSLPLNIDTDYFHLGAPDLAHAALRSAVLLSLQQGKVCPDPRLLVLAAPVPLPGPGRGGLHGL